MSNSAEDEWEDFTDLDPDEEPEEEIEVIEEPEEPEEPKPAVQIRDHMWSGWCQFPQTSEPHLSHERCQAKDGGNRANPRRVFQPCPCRCHLSDERYECGGCGQELAEALNISAVVGEETYVHIDVSGNAGSEYCS